MVELLPMAKKISETKSFQEIINEEVKSCNGLNFEIVNFIKENGEYIYTINVLDEAEKTLKSFIVFTWLNGDATKIHFGKR